MLLEYVSIMLSIMFFFAILAIRMNELILDVVFFKTNLIFHKSIMLKSNKDIEPRKKILMTKRSIFNDKNVTKGYVY